VELPDEYIYYLLGKEFGWTPEQIDNTENKLIESLLIIINTRTEVENKQLK